MADTLLIPGEPVPWQFLPAYPRSADFRRFPYQHVLPLVYLDADAKSFSSDFQQFFPILSGPIGGYLQISEVDLWEKSPLVAYDTMIPLGEAKRIVYEQFWRIQFVSVGTIVVALTQELGSAILNFGLGFFADLFLKGTGYRVLIGTVKAVLDRMHFGSVLQSGLNRIQERLDDCARPGCDGVTYEAKLLKRAAPKDFNPSTF